nr:hypothetical protein [Tanacetum cinerariifolium]
YEHLSTTPETKSDEVTKSSAKNLLPIPCEYVDTSDDESEYDVPVKDDSSPAFTTFSNPLFDYNDDFTSSDDYRDTLIDSSPKFEFLLKEFSGELSHINPCQPMDQNIDSSGSDQIQTPQYPVIHQPSQEMSEEVFHAKGDQMKSIRNFLEKFNRYPFGAMPKILSQAWEKYFEIQHAQPDDTNELFQELLEDFQTKEKGCSYLQTQLLIAQKEEAGIQLQAEEFDLVAAVADLYEIEEVNAKCILMVNL